MEKKETTFLLLLFGIFFIFPVLASSSPISETTTVTEYIIYLFDSIIAVGSFIAAAVLFTAGVDFISSQGDVKKISGAKTKIKNAFLGLIVLLSSFMILNTINPQIASISIDKLPESTYEEVVIPEGSGVYLYDAPGYVSIIDSLRVTETMVNFSDSKFTERTQSIKFVNPEGDQFKFGAVIFAKNVNSQLGSGYDLRGNCSFILSDISDLDSAFGKENNPPIGKNNLSSIIVFKTKTDPVSVTLYNSANCKKRSDEYGVQKDEENMCTINSSNGFVDLNVACPKFKGEVVSVQTSNNAGVLFKATKKDVAGRCQFFESNNNGCINTVKYSYVYNLRFDKYLPSIAPQSFMLFPLVK